MPIAAQSAKRPSVPPGQRAISCTSPCRPGLAWLGIGRGLVIGAHGYAGELGHLTVVPDGRLCGCGRRGCLEAYGSGRAIGSLGSELLASNSETLLRSVVTDPNLVTAEEVIAAAARGDVDSLQIVDPRLRYSRGRGSVQLVLDPEVVVFGGGLMSSKFFGDRLLGVFHGGGGADGRARWCGRHIMGMTA